MATVEPSDVLRNMINVAGERMPSEMAAAVNARMSDFRSSTEATLTGLALNPATRSAAESYLDEYWSDESRGQRTLARSNGREIIIGSGFHAATYAATRVLSGFPRPLVLERETRVGGTFGLTAWPTWYLNSRNRAGGLGLAGDNGAALNYLPGAPLQASNLSMIEYQTNADMALVIRWTLAQYADVVTDARVIGVNRDFDGLEIEMDDRTPVRAGRIIDARGLGDPTDASRANGSDVLTFPQFMCRMSSPWPLRGVRRVAVLGGGDSAKCSVESLLGIAPQPMMSVAGLDTVERVDWYARDLPTTCEQWQGVIRGRYQAIGRYLRPDRFGVRRLNVFNRRAVPVPLADGTLIDGRTYNLVILCTGNEENTLPGLPADNTYSYQTPSGAVVARADFDRPIWRVGPHARLPFTSQERSDGVADISNNLVSMFRTAGKTATLAATLPAVGD